jgi:hypothetical protein
MKLVVVWCSAQAVEEAKAAAQELEQCPPISGRSEPATALLQAVAIAQALRIHVARKLAHIASQAGIVASDTSDDEGHEAAASRCNPSRGWKASECVIRKRSSG